MSLTPALSQGEGDLKLQKIVLKKIKSSANNPLSNARNPPLSEGVEGRKL